MGKDGKHPNILGVPAKDAWPEVWNTIHPLLQNVIENRDAFWVEDQLIPIYRNGTIEEVYWNFGYTPVLGDSSEVEGVFVTCSETTEKVLAMKSLEEKGNELKRTIDAANLGTWDFDMKTSKIKINDKVIDWSGLKRNHLVSAEDLLSVVDLVDKDRVVRAIEKVIKPAKNNDLDISFFIKNRKLGKKREVRAVGQSLFDKNGNLYRFNGTIQDVTEQQATLRNLRKKEERFRQLVDNAPIGIAIVDADNFKVNVVNQKALDIWEKKIYECQDKPIFEVLPEIQNGLEPILTEILQTKREQTGTEYPFTLERKGVLERGFFNFIFKPVVENGTVTEIVLVAYEVTENVRAKFGIEETETQVKNVFDQFPIAMAIVEGPDLKLEVANDTMLKKFLKLREPRSSVRISKSFCQKKW